MSTTVLNAAQGSNVRAVVIEKDAAVRSGLVATLESAGFEPHGFDRAAPALGQLAKLMPDVVVTSLPLAMACDADGMDLLSRLREHDADLPAVLLADQSGEGADRATRIGLHRIIERDFADAALVDALSAACAQRKVAMAERRRNERSVLTSAIERQIVGKSPAICQLRDVILKLAPTPASVVIFGETGAGKEMVARSLHEFSGRTGPFVAINCAAIPENLIESELFGYEPGAYTGATKQRIGKIEYSSGGTLFLDEIEAMPLYFQVKLLRVLQERQVERLGSNKLIPVDLRVIAATKLDLKQCSEEGKFRSDLFYRLNVAKAKIPPLRERREDIPMLLEHFIHDAAERFGQQPAAVTQEVQQQLLTYEWPGNVRELRNIAEQIQLGIPLSIEDAEAETTRSLEEILASVEKALINDALLRHDGAANTACNELKINYSTLYRKMKQYDMDLSHYRAQGCREQARAAA